ncbi:MAG: hypothetical protein EZS28_005635 [Streblomastix strix]|uniref:Uncharacterized protein n=1 Tax=Streblomastix strix TaxID=222440 RepID=A0A5J4WVK1_9EUKA|nr:MAG: hypothetical protein EZS28_005635 [Streblomastix strix]
MLCQQSWMKIQVHYIHNRILKNLPLFETTSVLESNTSQVSNVFPLAVFLLIHYYHLSVTIFSYEPWLSFIKTLCKNIFFYFFGDDHTDLFACAFAFSYSGKKLMEKRQLGMISSTTQSFKLTFGSMNYVSEIIPPLPFFDIKSIQIPQKPDKYPEHRILKQKVENAYQLAMSQIQIPDPIAPCFILVQKINWYSRIERLRIIKALVKSKLSQIMGINSKYQNEFKQESPFSNSPMEKDIEDTKQIERKSNSSIHGTQILHDIYPKLPPNLSVTGTPIFNQIITGKSGINSPTATFLTSTVDDLEQEQEVQLIHQTLNDEELILSQYFANEAVLFWAGKYGEMDDEMLIDNQIGYWQGQNKSNPMMKIFVDFTDSVLAIPSSEAGIERKFSQAKRFMGIGGQRVSLQTFFCELA